MIYVTASHLGPQLGQFLVRYKREIVITVIVMTEIDRKCKIFGITRTKIIITANHTDEKHLTI
jgi:hypothetical protein